jgi:ABC-type nitrate/sulfonate/bicarbonate transport system substrate-binding protein
MSYRRYHPRAVYLAGLTLLPLLLAACGSTAPGQVTSATLALDWTPNTNHTGVYVAQQNNWYRDEDITLNLTPYSSSVSPEQLVATGQADFGISFTEGVTSARAAGLPVVSIAAVIQQNTSALVTLKSSGLDNVGKLSGKRYAGFGAPYEQPLIAQVIGCGGAKNTSFTYVTTDQDPIVALKSKQFDFAWIYMGWEGVEAQRQSVDLNTFMIKDNCVPDYYSPVIITSEKTIKERPDLVRHFLAATAKGYAYAASSPADAAKLLIAGAPKGTFDDEGLVTASQQYLSPRYAEGAKCWGQQTLEKWTNYPKFMFEHKAILDANGNPIASAPTYAAAFTNDYLPKC